MGIGKAVRGFGRALKSSKSPKTLKVKPLAERRVLGGGQTEKIMGGIQEVKKGAIKAQQASNKYRMKYEGYESGKRQPLKSDAKDDIRIAREARKRRAKTRKEQAAAVAGGGAAIGAVAKLGESYEKKKKAKKTEGMEKRVKKAKGGKVLKPVDKNKNPGLAKLPTQVRNKMGYMKDGGMVKVKRIQIKGFGKARH